MVVLLDLWSHGCIIGFMVLLFFFVIQLRGWAPRTWDWGADTLLLFYSTFMLYRKSLYDQYNQCTSVEQEGAEEEPENNEDAPDDVIGGEGEDKEQEKTKRECKTTKYMTKYERARILGTRALQIRLIL